uniref:Thioredoxin domain-containing protein n=1 Tax=Odontella aurita TaxID=265563 RepID=A0A7S4JBV4_9STRA|mmetsp:Transcript_43298/g.131759  ORF Transcript_43298/g.131759 Transcript_43298/m.131759 type:complete len:180 (+) Transcript_43298:50-589(+)
MYLCRSQESSTNLLLLFKANKCPHCQRMAPDYEKLSEDDDLKGNDVTLATIDVPSNRGSSIRFGIRGFPTLIYFHNGRIYRYSGKRQFTPIKSFVMKGYENYGDGEEVPPKPTFLSQFVLIGKAVWAELYDAAQGKAGMVGYAMIVLMGILVGLLGMLVVFLITILTGRYDDVDKVKGD